MPRELTEAQQLENGGAQNASNFSRHITNSDRIVGETQGAMLNDMAEQMAELREHNQRLESLIVQQGQELAYQQRQNSQMSRYILYLYNQQYRQTASHATAYGPYPFEPILPHPQRAQAAESMARVPNYYSLAQQQGSADNENTALDYFKKLPTSFRQLVDLYRDNNLHEWESASARRDWNGTRQAMHSKWRYLHGLVLARSVMRDFAPHLRDLEERMAAAADSYDIERGALPMPMFYRKLKVNDPDKKTRPKRKRNKQD
jgi:hypothetical protein